VGRGKKRPGVLHVQHPRESWNAAARRRQSAGYVSLAQRIISRKLGLFPYIRIPTR
jgi:hypothetical protein